MDQSETPVMVWVMLEPVTIWETINLANKRKPQRNALLSVFVLLFGVVAPTRTSAEESPTTLSVSWAPLSLSVSQALGVNSKNVVEKCSQLTIIESDGATRLDCSSIRFSHLRNTMTPCVIDARISCIKKLEIQLPNEPWQEAEYQGPAGVPTQVWAAAPSIDLGPASNGSLYVSRDRVGRASVWHVSTSYRLSSTELVSGPKTYDIDIKPVRQIPRSECLELWKTFEGFTQTIDGGETSDCFGRLLRPASFKARLLLQLVREPRGWATGFVKDFKAEMDSGPREDGRRLVKIEGGNSIVPLVVLRVDSTDTARRQQFCNAQLSGWLRHCQGSLKWLGRNIFVSYSSGTANGKPPYLALLEQFPEMDTASLEWSGWSMQLNMQQDSTLGVCTAPRGIYGSVSSNALMTDDSLPLWNPATQTLEFGVTSPHHRSNGDAAVGFYEMQLNERVARCLWGTKVTPQNVSLSVTDERGEKKVAATTIALRDGMVIFRASGFTYSTTKLRISLTKPESRISCTKNGVAKLQPKGVTTCPKGWRKK